MAVPKKKKSSSATKRQRDAYKKNQQAKLEGAIQRAIRDEKGAEIVARQKTSVSTENITVVQA